MTMRTLALAAIILFVFDPGYSQQLRRVDSVKVVDARGRTVGKGASTRSVGSGDLAEVVAVTVILEVDGHLISALAFRNFLSANAVSLQGPWFTSTDCSGTPYLAVGEPGAAEQGLLPHVAINVPGDTVYIRDFDAEPQTVTIHSGFVGFPSEQLHGFCGITPAESLRMFPARPLIDLDTRFTPPFRAINTSEDNDDEDDTR